MNTNKHPMNIIITAFSHSTINHDALLFFTHLHFLLQITILNTQKNEKYDRFASRLEISSYRMGGSIGGNIFHMCIKRINKNMSKRLSMHLNTSNNTKKINK